MRRYGYHGLSCAFLMEELAHLGDPAAVKGRVILAHLGNGASLAAVRDGKPVDTSMSFTPTAGVPMSTRSGDLDPGLLGMSETSSDMRDLLACKADDARAAEAVALICYQAKSG